MLMRVKTYLAKFLEHVAIQFNFKMPCIFYRQTCMEEINDICLKRPGRPPSFPLL